MNLATLPLDILNECCSHLSDSLDDLLALSYTSRSLNQAANRYLFRTLNLSEWSDHKLVSGLRINPSNALHIRSYVCSEPGRLRRIWSNPLSLHRLQVQFRVPQVLRNPYYVCLASKHPNLWCRELVLKCNGKHENYLLQRLNTIGGLTKLALEIPTKLRGEISHVTTQAIVDLINCPQLKHLAIFGAPNPRSQLRHKLPNLISFEVSLQVGRRHGASRDIFRPTEYMWDTFSDMMRQSIYFHLSVPICECGCFMSSSDAFNLFYKNLRKYARQMHLDSTHLVHRLAASECFFNNPEGRIKGPTARLSVDFGKDRMSASRALQVRKLSGVIHSIIFPEYKPTHLRLSVTFDEKSSEGAGVYLLNDHRMAIELHTGIVTDVISRCSPFLSNLRHILFEIPAERSRVRIPTATVKSKYFIGKAEVSVELPLTEQLNVVGVGYVESKYSGVFVLRKNEVLDAGIQKLARYFDLLPTLECVELSATKILMTLTNEGHATLYW